MKKIREWVDHILYSLIGIGYIFLGITASTHSKAPLTCREMIAESIHVVGGVGLLILVYLDAFWLPQRRWFKSLNLPPLPKKDIPDEIAIAAGLTLPSLVGAFSTFMAFGTTHLQLVLWNSIPSIIFGIAGLLAVILIYINVRRYRLNDHLPNTSRWLIKRDGTVSKVIGDTIWGPPKNLMALEQGWRFTHARRTFAVHFHDGIPTLNAETVQRFHTWRMNMPTRANELDLYLESVNGFTLRDGPAFRFRIEEIRKPAN